MKAKKEIHKDSWTISSVVPDSAHDEVQFTSGEAMTYNPRLGAWLSAKEAMLHPNPQPSSFFISALKNCYRTNEAANRALTNYYRDLQENNPLALAIENLEDQTGDALGNSVDALNEAANQGEKNPYDNAEAVRLFRELNQHIEQFNLAFISWAKKRAFKGLEDNLEKLKIPSRNTQQALLFPRNSALSPVFYFTGDNIHRAVVTSYARAAEWQDGEGYYRGLQQDYSNLKITVFLPDDNKAASLWEFLQSGGPAMIKAHYALWARYYEQVPDGLEVQDVIVNINDFCRDLGYSKAKNGGYKPEAKRRAMQLLNALTSTEMIATYQVPGQKPGHTKTRRLKGTIWRRGLEAEERDTYEDLLGSIRAGNPAEWIPAGFTFSPGAWHADKEWRRFNKFVGKLGAGLMRLDVRYDEWAILIGGYLGTLARTGKYRNRRLKISTILENTGLNAAIGHRKSQFREKFYRALDRLVEEKIIVGYETEGFDDSDVDPDDLKALAEYGMSDPFPEGDWRSHIVEITFDFDDDKQRLEMREQKAIAAKNKGKKKPENTA